MNQLGIVYIIGAGPGDPDLITVRGLKCLRRADVVVYDRLINRELLDEVPIFAEYIYVGKEPGHHTLLQWKDHLQHENLRAFAWAAVTATYSPSFLRTNIHRLPAWIESVCESHTSAGLLSLMEQTHEEDPVSEWSVPSMAERLSTTTSSIGEGRLLVGQLDQMAPVDQVQALGDRLDWPVHIVPNVGHAVATEAPRVWRQDLLNFLNDDDD